MSKTSHSCTGGNTVGNLFRKNSQSHFKNWFSNLCVLCDANKFFFPKNSGLEFSVMLLTENELIGSSTEVDA